MVQVGLRSEARVQNFVVIGNPDGRAGLRRRDQIGKRRNQPAEKCAEQEPSQVTRAAERIDKASHTALHWQKKNKGHHTLASLKATNAALVTGFAAA
jgi:hypothetical protein